MYSRCEMQHNFQVEGATQKREITYSTSQQIDVVSLFKTALKDTINKTATLVTLMLRKT